MTPHPPPDPVSAGPRLLTPGPSAVAEAVAALHAGALIGLPTETVYGLAGDATNPDAVAAIFAAKGRPSFNPLIIHCADWSAASALGQFSEAARTLAQIHWPGPLTLVVPRSQGSPVVPAATAGLSTVALRVPAHPVARRILETFGRPVAAPSANPSGRLSPTDPRHVIQGLGDRVALVLAAGRTAVGLESSVVDCTTDPVTLLRPGAITLEMLIQAVGAAVTGAGADRNDPAQRPRSPGLLLRHYAPTKPVRLQARDGFTPAEALLTFGPNPFLGHGARWVRNLSARGDLAEAAANLFAFLRDADEDEQTTAIAVAPIPETGLGVAINDRLSRAAAAAGEEPDA